MAEREPKALTREELLDIIDRAAREEWTELDLSERGISELPGEIGQLTNLQMLYLGNNRLTTLPEVIGRLINLHTLDLHRNQLVKVPELIGQLACLRTFNLDGNKLATLPESIGQLTNLRNLGLSGNQLATLPKVIGQLTSLRELNLSGNELTLLPEFIGQLTNLEKLHLIRNQLTTLPEVVGRLTNLQILDLRENQLVTLPEVIGQLTDLQILALSFNPLMTLPDAIGQLTDLQALYLQNNQLAILPEIIGQLTDLQRLDLEDNQLTTLPEVISQLTKLEMLLLNRNQLTTLPSWLPRLENLEVFILDDNPLNPALQSAYDAGLDELMAYLRSLEEAEPLFEAKLILVGEGGVGKTTLLKALMGREGQEPRADEPTTHGVQIDVHALHLPHPGQDGKQDVEIQLNAWDFGGQEVYRVTHQFFFSRRSLYLLVWEPRRGVGQCQVEDWLKLIRLRVGDDARVFIVSTHCRTGERIARIDRPVFRRDYGAMIAGFYEVDSLVDDPATGEQVGIAELKGAIAREAAGLEQMGMPMGRSWRQARDELLARPEPRIPYARFARICATHDLSAVAARTLAHLMHDLGYVVYYGEEEQLQDDVVLQPQWLTKAIGFVLEDRGTQEMDGILPDRRLHEVWYKHPFENEPRYAPDTYPFLLRLMEKFDVSYRLPDGTASLVAQHVPQVRPDLPWLPEQRPPEGRRRIAMVCAMEEEPPGLVPWMIVRTHDYATELPGDDGEPHRLHWQKGMFLRHPPHGEAVLEQRGREFHVYTQATWPEYFMNLLQHTLHKLITDNWPGLEGRYRFTVPCPEHVGGQSCKGRFNIAALRQFLAEGDATIRCQECLNRQSISELLFGFEEPAWEEQLQRIEQKLDGLHSRIANYVMALMHAIADEAKHGPRLFTIHPMDEGWRLAPRRLVTTRLRLQLWCEAEGCQHPVFDGDLGVYAFSKPLTWVRHVVPYANFVLTLLKAVLPVAAPAVDTFFGKDTVKNWDYAAHLDLAKAIAGQLPGEIDAPRRPDERPGVLTEVERSGLLALHALLRELDPHHERLGLKRVATYTGDYRWLCRQHYREWQPKIPDKIEVE